ncbi:hypothetical protein ABTL53_19625, partial [Acinetobacter baumannii]
MITRKIKWAIFCSVILFSACDAQPTTKKPSVMNTDNKNTVYSKTDTNKVVMKNEEWKQILSP